MDVTHGFMVRTRDTRQEIVDQSAIVPLYVTAPADLSNSIAAFHDSGSRVVSQQSGVRLDLNSSIPLPRGCLLFVDFPPSLSRNLTTRMRFVYLQGLFGSLRSVPFSFTAEHQIEIQDACPTHNIVDDSIGSIKLKYVQNPDTVRPTESFVVKISDEDGNILA